MKNENEYDNIGYNSSLYDSDENKKKSGTISCVISIIFLLWFAGSVLLSFYLSATASAWLVPIIVMHIFLVICLIDIVQRLIKKQKPQLMLVIIGIGSIIGMILVCVYHFNETESFRELFVRLLAVAFLLLIMSIGVTFTIKSFIGDAPLRKRCTQSVYAVCTKADEKWKTVNNKTYRECSLVYELDWNGEIIELQEVIHTKDTRTLGESQELFVNPENPYEFYDPGDINDKSNDIMAGAMFTIIPLIMLILTLIYAF